MVDSLARSAARRVIAADTNAVHALFAGTLDDKTLQMRRAFEAGQLLLPPPVLSEALSDPTLPIEKAVHIRAIPLIDLLEGYWERAGMLRGSLKSEGYKAVLADCLIAQSCIDHDIPLITYDRDFRHFVRAGLKLA